MDLEEEIQSAGNSDAEAKTGPSICTKTDFIALDDARNLKKALRKNPVDEAEIIKILGMRDNPQRQRIATAYNTDNGQVLIDDLTSKLSGEFRNVATTLVTLVSIYFVNRLCDSMHGFRTRAKTLIDILCTADNAQIHEINDTYSKLHRRGSLSSKLSRKTSGDFWRFLDRINSRKRDENMPQEEAKAISDASELYNAGEGRWGTNEQKFVDILSNRSFGTIRLICNEYRNFPGHRSLEEAIEREFSGDLRRGLLAVVKYASSPADYFAERLHDSLSYSSFLNFFRLGHLARSDGDLIFIVVTRSEIDMEDIKTAYQKKYNISLAESIRNATTGDYAKMLLTLIGEYH